MLDEKTAEEVQARDAVVELLRNIHDWRQRSPSQATTAVRVPPLRDNSAYDRARKHFLSHELRLRQEGAVSEALIEQIRAERAPTVPDSAVAISQQTLRLVAAQGAAPQGRFAISNDRREPLTIRFECSGLQTCEGGDLCHVSVEFDPVAPTLLPGETQLVGLSVGLPPGHRAPRSELRVDVWSGGERVLLLWVEIDSRAAGLGGGDV